MIIPGYVPIILNDLLPDEKRIEVFLPYSVVDIMVLFTVSEYKIVWEDLSKATPKAVAVIGIFTTDPVWRSICSILPWKGSVTMIKLLINWSKRKKKVRNLQTSANTAEGIWIIKKNQNNWHLLVVGTQKY